MQKIEIIWTPNVSAYVRAVNALDDAMNSGGIVIADELIDARTAARAALVADGFTDEHFAELSLMF